MDNHLLELVRFWQENHTTRHGYRVIRNLVRGGLLPTCIDIFIQNMLENKFVSQELFSQLPFPVVLHYVGLGTKAGIEVIFEDPVYNFDKCCSLIPAVPLQIRAEELVEHVSDDRNLRIDLDALVDFVLDISEALVDGNLELWSDESDECLWPAWPDEIEHHFEHLQLWQLVYQIRTRTRPNRGSHFATLEALSCWRMLQHVRAFIQLFTHRAYQSDVTAFTCQPTEYQALLSNNIATNIDDEGNQYPIGWVFYLAMHSHLEKLHLVAPWEYEHRRQGSLAMLLDVPARTDDLEALANHAGINFNHLLLQTQYIRDARADLNSRVVLNLIDYIIRYALRA